MSDWSGITYREFWDVPRMVIARRGAGTYLFHSRFDESLDDYIDHYEVWRMPSLTADELRQSWVGLELRALERLPNIGLQQLPFEVTSRNSVDIDVVLREEGR
jgi:hypothetical protein